MAHKYRFFQRNDFVKNGIFPKNDSLVKIPVMAHKLWATQRSAKMSIVMCECKLHLNANKKHIYILSYILANILDSQYILWNSDAGGCTPKKTFEFFEF